MADPFSVAGTAVGITSLGIQTCQILYNYYSKYKGYHDDIDSVLQEVEGLQSILESLRQVKDRFEIDNNVPSSQLHIALKACEDALARLKAMADRCNTTKQTESIQSRLRDVKKRLIWPYRKETLADMQATLSRFQDNLSLALQCAGFDGIARRLDDQLPRLNAISHQATSMEQSLISQASVLKVIHRGVNDVSQAQRQHDFALSREMVDLRDHISACTKIVGSKLELVARSVSSLHDPALVAPLILADAIETLGNVQHHVQSSLESYNSHSLELERAGANDSLLPLCRCRTKKKQSFQRRRWMSILSVGSYQHDTECTQFAASDHMRSVAAQFMVYNKVLQACIQVGWESSRTKGWNTIAPMLRYTAVVSQDTGAFKIFNDAERSLLALRFREPKDGERMTQILSETAMALQATLGKDFSPLDIDEHGNSILHAVLTLIYVSIIRSCPQTDLIDGVQSLLDICLTGSVPFNQPNAWGFTPIVSFQWNVSINSSGRAEYETLRHLARRTGDWSLYTPKNNDPHANSQLYDSLSELLKSEELTSALDEDDDLYLAIVRRSEVEFCNFITSHIREDVTHRLAEVKNLFALAAWSQGIEALISKGLADDDSSLATILWRAALHMKAMRSMVVLLRLNLQVTRKDWIHANQGWVWRGERRGLERTQWAQVFDNLACLLSPPNDSLVGFQDRGSSNAGESEMHLYNCRLSLPGAESLWKFGHRNLNSMRCVFQHDECNIVRHYGTPLWCAAIRLSSELILSLSIFRWLLEHGALAIWIHPVFFTTPAHIYVRNFISLAATGERSEHLEKFNDLLLLGHPDSCVCYCSKEGCRFIGGALAKHCGEFAWFNQNFQRQTTKKDLQAIQLYIFRLAQKDRTAAWMSSAILRVLTFDALSLTHTCCYRVQEEIYEFFQRPTPEEAKVIYDLEREDIELLENLTTDFELKLATYTKPFVTFMNRVWKPRMRAIRAERRVEKDIYEAELQRIGVRLKQAGEEETESDSESDSDWSDDYESEGDGWYTTDEEDGGVMEEERDSDEEASQPSHEETDDGL
ncbi:hypothetical protein HBI23_131770 [Parastagonospora nodorum]|nr:hypothetical protein HBI47_031280 [Parastagonospora nodorum]KAH5660273.1 hypothetical protein HBI23_131770 [Parastagonospora nodorum]